MSWDIVLFNSRQTITSADEIDPTQLEATDFDSVLQAHFKQIENKENHREIIGEDYSIDYFIDAEHVSNKLLNLYGEKGLYELILLARKHNWQIYDSGLGEMLDINNPSKNGYDSFQNYLRKVLKQ
ncbi:MAG: hypothetical protein R2852_06845 [Bacteroidia bacterium]